MRTIEERIFRDASGARWAVRLIVPEAFSDRVTLSAAEIRFVCESHAEHWVVRRREGSLPKSDAELDALLQKARREGSSL